MTCIHKFHARSKVEGRVFPEIPKSILDLKVMTGTTDLQMALMLNILFSSGWIVLVPLHQAYADALCDLFCSAYFGLLVDKFRFYSIFVAFLKGIYTCIYT